MLNDIIVVGLFWKCCNNRTKKQVREILQEQNTPSTYNKQLIYTQLHLRYRTYELKTELHNFNTEVECDVLVTAKYCQWPMLLITGKADPEMMITEKYGQSLLQIICALALNNVRKSVHRLGLDSNGTKASHVQELCAYVSNDGKVVCIQTHYNCIFTTRKYGMVMNSVRILSSESLHFHFILLRSYIEVIRGALHSKTGSNRSNQLRL